MKQTGSQVRARCGAAAGMGVMAALLWGCGPAAVPPSGGPETASFLEARLRGAIDADLAWNDANLLSEGGARPDGSGIRVSLAGELAPGGQRIRLVFGIGAPPGRPNVRAAPTNLTLILEGANRVYATLGDDKCSVDTLTQQPVVVAGGAPAPGDYWVSARGFCVEPAATLDGAERVLVSRFDFRGRIHLEESDLRVTAPDS